MIKTTKTLSIVLDKLVKPNNANYGVVIMAIRKKKIEEYENRFKEARVILSVISEDNTTPRNIRRAAKEALDILILPDQSHGVRAAEAVSLLDEISQDQNMPRYTRSRIWSVVSILEIVKE